jgi:hypothetical protein
MMTIDISAGRPTAPLNIEIIEISPPLTQIETDRNDLNIHGHFISASIDEISQPTPITTITSCTMNPKALPIVASDVLISSALRKMVPDIFLHIVPGERGHE